MVPLFVIASCGAADRGLGAWSIGSPLPNVDPRQTLNVTYWPRLLIQRLRSGVLIVIVGYPFCQQKHMFSNNRNIDYASRPRSSIPRPVCPIHRPLTTYLPSFVAIVLLSLIVLVALIHKCCRGARFSSSSLSVELKASGVRSYPHRTW